jgi:hypothetical protein
VRNGIRLATVVFAATWIPLTVWRGLALGRTFRIGSGNQSDIGPLVEGMIQVSAVMLAPALFAALFAFALWAWREERRHTRSTPHHHNP